MSEWFHRRGELAKDGWETVVDESIAGWQHTGVRIATLAAGSSLSLPATGVERIIVPLAGSFTVAHGDVTTALTGRRSVFDGPTDTLYLSCASTAVISGEGRFAVAESPTTEVKADAYLPAASVPVELRGAGASSRQVHNFGTPAALDAARLIVCEVITPAGNWSSYPPHKHDEYVPGHESALEEIYYFESSPTVGESASAFGLFSTYSSPAGEIQIDTAVYTGDVALVPYGYHGPAVAAPGYDLYYLNVMAGPGPVRQWLASDDPAHAWVRESWADEQVDARLPLTKAFPTRGKGPQ